MDAPLGVTVSVVINWSNCLIIIGGDRVKVTLRRICMHGFNMALHGKRIWNFMQNPNTLMARVVFKGRYFPHDHVLKATKGQDSSFLWTGIQIAKEELKEGFRFRWKQDQFQSGAVSIL